MRTNTFRKTLGVAIAALAMLVAGVAFPATAEATNYSDWCLRGYVADGGGDATYGLHHGPHGLPGTDIRATVVLLNNASCGEPNDSRPLCFGVPATIVSNAAVVHGTDDYDVIVGGPASQTIYGGGGRDLICARGGNDTIHGNTGDDLIDGGTGNDHIYGGNRQDTLFGGPGNDYVNGGTGHDYLVVGHGADTVLGGSGNDFLTFIEDGVEARSVLNGGPGIDMNWDPPVIVRCQAPAGALAHACVAPGSGTRW